MTLGEVCAHGSLARQCEICERDARIVELEKEIEKVAGRALVAETRLKQNEEEAERRSKGWDRAAKEECEACGGSVVDGRCSVCRHLRQPRPAPEKCPRCQHEHIRGYCLLCNSTCLGGTGLPTSPYEFRRELMKDNHGNVAPILTPPIPPGFRPCSICKDFYTNSKDGICIRCGHK